MTFHADHEYPARWRRAPGLPLLAQARWHEAMRGRLDGEACWFTEVDGQDLAAGLAGFVVRDADAYRYGNPYSLLLAPDTPFGDGAVRGALSSHPVPPGSLLPALVLTFPGYATFPIGAQADDEHTVGHLLHGVVGWAAQCGLSAVVLLYAEASGRVAAAARDLGFASLPLTYDAWLDVPAGGFDQYVQRLPGHRRRRVRAERRGVHAAGLRTRLVTRFTPELLGRFGALRALHRQRYGLPADATAEADRLAQLVGRLDDATSATVVAAPDGPPVSFAMQVADGDTWHEICCGTDHADPRSRFAAFEAVFYGPIDLAATSGIRRISFGVAAEEAKIRRGARLVPLAALVSGLTAAARSAVDVMGAAWGATAADPRSSGPTGEPVSLGGGRR